MPKQVKRNPYPAPAIEDFIQCHGGREVVTYAQAGEILSMHPKTVGNMARDGRLTYLNRKVTLRSIYAYIWPQRGATP